MTGALAVTRANEPTRLGQLIGNESAVLSLREPAARGEPRHAYLFTGPEGVGKYTAAELFMRSLTCQQPDVDGEACGECASCAQHAADRHPDVSRVHPVLASKPSSPGEEVIAPGRFALPQIPIHRIRRLQQDLQTRAVYAPRRVCVVRDANSMEEVAQNAFLKTLEEPPPGATVILVASSGAGFLPTIVSRCQVVRFGAVSRDLIREWLTGMGFETADADWLSAWSMGRPGEAVRWQRPEMRSLRNDILTLLETILRAPTVQCYALAHAVTELARCLWDADLPAQKLEELSGTDATRAVRGKVCEVIDLMARWFRDVWLAALGADSETFSCIDQGERLDRWSAAVSAGRAREALLACQTHRRHCVSNANLQLNLEALMANLVRLCSSQAQW